MSATLFSSTLCARAFEKVTRDSGVSHPPAFFRRRRLPPPHPPVDVKGIPAPEECGAVFR